MFNLENQTLCKLNVFFIFVAKTHLATKPNLNWDMRFIYRS